MKDYYVNNRAQSNGDHEVHSEGCDYMPSDKKHLGKYSSCNEAVIEAKKTYSTANGYKYCCSFCHTT